MTLPPFDLTRLPGEWWQVEPSEGERLEQELRREVSQGHRLHGVSVRAVAVRRHLKDVVFWLPDVRQWACIHLTWQVENDPKWPSAICTPDWDEIVAQFTE